MASPTVTPQALVSQLVQMRKDQKELQNQIIELGQCLDSLPRGMSMIERVLARIGGLQYPLRKRLGPIEITASDVAGTTDSDTLEVDQTVALVCPRVMCAAKISSGTYDGLYFPIGSNHLRIVPDNTVRTTGYLSYFDHIGAFDAELEIERSTRKEQDKPIPLSAMFDENGVYDYPVPRVIHPGETLTATTHIRVAPETDIDLYLIFDCIACEGGRVKKMPDDLVR